MAGFRPLSRYIGLYQRNTVHKLEADGFPSPLEVYRFISDWCDNHQGQTLGFRPLSRYIGLYQRKYIVGFVSM